MENNMSKSGFVIPKRHTTPTEAFQRDGNVINVHRITSSSEVMGQTCIDVQILFPIPLATEDEAIIVLEGLFYGEDG